jgi:hypothetical protein
MERSSLPLLHGKAERMAERRTEVSKKVSDILPKTEILAQVAEEASELAQAALKLRRALDGTNPTPKSVEECRKAFEEEYADVVNCIIALDCMDDAAFDRMQKMQHEKEIRWLSRLKEKEQLDE